MQGASVPLPLGASILLLVLEINEKKKCEKFSKNFPHVDNTLLSVYEIRNSVL